MSKVIEVLETMARNANLNNQAAVEVLINNAEINAEQSKAIIAKDVTSLERQLDICPDVYCILFPAEDESPEDSDAPSEEENDNTQSVINF